MSKNHCPVCGTELNDFETICHNCGYDTERTVQINSTHNIDSAQHPQPGYYEGEGYPSPNPQRNKLKTILIIIAAVFVTVDIVLAVLYFVRKSNLEKEAELLRLEQLEKARTDSIAAVERDRFVRDSIVSASETKKHFAQFSTIFKSVSATRNDYYYDSTYNASTKISAFEFTPDLPSTLKKRGYTLISRKTKSIELEGGYEKMEQTVWGINCKWDEAGDYPTSTVAPWSCVLITPAECFDTIRIFFDSAESRDAFWNNMTNKGLTRQSEGAYSGEMATREGSSYVIYNDYCSSSFVIRKDINNTIVIQ